MRFSNKILLSNKEKHFNRFEVINIFKRTGKKENALLIPSIQKFLPD